MGKSESRVLKVAQGDTLWGLGERHGVPWEHIQVFNKLRDHTVYAGEELKLPPQRTKAWVVESGDSAWEIAERFGLTLEEVQDVNGGIPEVLYPGDVLLVPEDAVLRPRQLISLRAVKARLKGIAVHANAKFFDVFPYPQDIDNYREKHRLLLNALRHVESSFIMPAPIGDNGLSIGPLQISTEYHQDAWWQASSTVKYEHCEEVDYAERTVINYWLRYCPWALEFGDWETLARTHNGGPCYWHHFSTTRYWRRVKNALRSRGYIQGIPEFSSSARDNSSIQLFNTHIPFVVPILESKVKDNPDKGASQLQTTSAVMEAATVGVPY
ncbi:uncharacterized protein [Physcomitrium patens]|uniref:lysozyme n=1 Tax=Physcomitrium patens TaxID=3218 RepID=A9STB5_PHYPA|nr:uncharacterized protein LOC112282477 isoform X1 [Physcomitrium patens]PNR54135.1 hypothetical protein PHYPA_007811 [Physcomitrium patens]|eukprot:XP_024375858.1 uncharacterized protein LOC112282477 isoform X1 [Physcomitrella patens]